MQPLLSHVLRSDVEGDVTCQTGARPCGAAWRDSLVGVTYNQALRDHAAIPCDVVEALQARVAIVNGAPGTGKTFQAATVVSTMVEAARRRANHYGHCG